LAADNEKSRQVANLTALIASATATSARRRKALVGEAERNAPFGSEDVLIQGNLKGLFAQAGHAICCPAPCR
jgi:hypothetical protein